jgi:hypothetical protein
MKVMFAMRCHIYSIFDLVRQCAPFELCRISAIAVRDLITRGRNRIVRDFLADESVTRLFIDSDIEFGPQVVCWLLPRRDSSGGLFDEGSELARGRAADDARGIRRRQVSRSTGSVMASNRSPISSLSKASKKLPKRPPAPCGPSAGLSQADDSISAAPPYTQWVRTTAGPCLSAFLRLRGRSREGSLFVQRFRLLPPAARYRRPRARLQARPSRPAYVEGISGKSLEAGGRC